MSQGNTIRRALLAWLVYAAAALAGCSDDGESANGDPCEVEDDCPTGYYCISRSQPRPFGPECDPNPEERVEDPGHVCWNALPDYAPVCGDLDCDGVMSGQACDPEIIQDCDDNNPDVPNVEELCNIDDEGYPIDDDCDGILDEDDSGMGRPLTMTCGLDGSGEGVATCVDGQWGPCE